MMLIDDNLKYIAKDNEICEREDLIEDFCIQVRLSTEIYYKLKKTDLKITYGTNSDSISDGYEKLLGSETPMILQPMDRVLACSQEKYKIPRNTFGLIQTKGSLARLFVQVTCCDGQIEPGFEGKITLEIVNLSPFTIELPALSKVAQLYLFQCSMKSKKPYSGKYAESNGPTLPDFNGF
ncbi:TPA: dCTP deaminase [Providencia alcalifaciens]|nr:dCTP deaminase [Providencia alcalifaciens]